MAIERVKQAEADQTKAEGNMPRLTWLLLVSMLVAPAGRCAAQTGPANMLLNSSFEQGRAEPADWAWFGVASRSWEFGGRDGDRCITISGDGADAGWWYATRWLPIQRNQLYRVSFWARAAQATAGQRPFIGLNLCEVPVALGPKWQRHEFYFRSPDYMPDPKFRIGQHGMQGQAFFDDVSLTPVVAVHRSAGGGAGITLGDGERIAAGRYVATDDPTTWHTTDSRFLDSYTAEYHGDRWVLDHRDEVVYKHEIRRIGVPEWADTAPNPDHTSFLTGGGIARGFSMPGDQGTGDLRGESALLQRPLSICIEVGGYGGPVAVELRQAGRPWQEVGLITRPGASVIALGVIAQNTYEVWVRLKSRGGGRTEVTRYRYESLIAGDSSSTETGTSRYLAILYSDPDAKVNVLDLGDLIAGGRSQVKLLVETTKRVLLDCRVAVESDGEEVGSEGVTHWMAVGARRRIHIPYVIPNAAPHVLRITGRDANTGRLLFLLETSPQPAPT